MQWSIWQHASISGLAKVMWKQKCSSGMCPVIVTVIGGEVAPGRTGDPRASDSGTIPDPFGKKRYWMGWLVWSLFRVPGQWWQYSCRAGF